MADAELQRWFFAIDTDRSGSITALELQRALGLGDLQFSLQACAQMVRLHDRDGSATICFDEFRSLHHQLTDIRSRFTAAAAASGGGPAADSVTFAQLQAMVEQQGYRLEAPSFKALALAFDPDCNGRFGLPEVTMLTLSLLSAKQIFAAFDPQGSGRVNLDFSQFVYAASQTR